MPLRRILIPLFACFALFTLTLAAQAAGPDKQALLEAWEAAQLDDPQTLIFEKVADKRYTFQTDRFPYEGEITVLNLSISDMGYPAADGETTIMGVVEVELAGVDDEFYRKYWNSYSNWQQSNIFYWERKAGEWVPAVDWEAGQSASYQSSWFDTWIMGNLSLWIPLVVLFIFLILFGGKASRQMKQAMGAQHRAIEAQDTSLHLMEQAMELSREQNRLLGEILAELKKGKE